MPKRIMIVDDSKTTRSMVTFTLRRAGYEVIEAEDGRQALAVGGGVALDCMITDINMPGMDGLELIREMRARPTHLHTPIIMLTTATDVAKKEEGQRSGANGWLGKPFHPAHLLELVSRMISAPVT